jgi:hypothetical protein
MGTYQSESDRNRAALLAGMQGQGYNQALAQQQQQLGNLQNMAQFQTGMESQGIAGMEAVGAQAQALEQQKLNQLAAAGQTAYTLPMNRLTDVANIYGSIAGAMPGSPTQKFTPSPIATGIGGFANMWQVMNDPKNKQMTTVT